MVTQVSYKYCYCQSVLVPGLERGDVDLAGLRYSGGVACYGMRREEIRGKGMVLAVADEVLRSCKVGNVLFRVWFQV